MRRVATTTFVLVAVAATFAGVLYFTGLHPLPEYRVDTARVAIPPIMTSERYGAVITQHRRPYVYQQDLKPGAVLVFGAEHTKDPADHQLVQMRERWKAFAPTAALIEGRLQFLPVLLIDPVTEYGEAGFAAILARDTDVKPFTWEPPLAEEIAAAKRGFSPEQAALFFVLRPYFGTLRHGKPDDPDGFVEKTRAKRTRWPGLEGTLPDVAAIDRMWRRDFAGRPDWRDTSDQFGLPGYLARIADNVGRARDLHLVAAIIDLTSKGERVFVVAGSAHAVKIEPALVAASRQAN